MKKLNLLLSVIFLTSASFSFSQGITESTWQDGDIIFIKNLQMPLGAAQGDKKQFNCVGLILHEDNHAYVYYVGDKLKRDLIWDFIGMSEDKKYSVKWLAEPGLITPDVINTMATYCKAKLGLASELKEDLNTEELYNAEFVWKIYLSSLGVKLAEPKEFTASGDIKKEPTSAGFANKSVSVRDIYRSELLE